MRVRSAQKMDGKLCDSPVSTFKTTTAALPLGQYECGRRRPEKKSLFGVASCLEQTEEEASAAAEESFHLLIILLIKTHTFPQKLPRRQN